MVKKTFKVKGMHCKSCEILAKDSLEELDGVDEATLSHEKGNAVISFDPNKVNENKNFACIGGFLDSTNILRCSDSFKFEM